MLDSCNSHLSSMEVYWDALPPNEKGFHKAELLEYRNQLNGARDQYFQLEKGVERDRREVEQDPEYRLDQEIRGKAVGGITKLDDQER